MVSRERPKRRSTVWPSPRCRTLPSTAPASPASTLTATAFVTMWIDCWQLLSPRAGAYRLWPSVTLKRFRRQSSHLEAIALRFTHALCRVCRHLNGSNCAGSLCKRSTRTRVVKRMAERLQVSSLAPRVADHAPRPPDIFFMPCQHFSRTGATGSFDSRQQNDTMTNKALLHPHDSVG